VRPADPAVDVAVPVIAWYWGLVNALLVTAVIWMNGRGWRAGWLLGAGAQAWIVAFGIAHGAWTFAFSAIPLIMFLVNWSLHRRRQLPQRYVLREP
jgi:hypothetical protein